MRFTLSAEQRQFHNSLHGMLAAADAIHSGRLWAAGNREPALAIWRSLADAGVTGLTIPAELGGLGAHPVDLVVACDELGHHAVPGPVPESLAAVPQLLAAVRGATPSRVDAWLARIGSGQLIVTVAAPPLVPFAADVGMAGLVLLAERDAVRIAQLGPMHGSVAAARTLSEVTGGQLIADGPEVASAVRAAMDFGTVACAAQLLGASRAMLEATARHARHRAQFGRPIGANQAVKHQLANVLIKVEFARTLLFAAAMSLADGLADSGREVSAAKVACADAANLAARTALQIHGAIGYTAEHDLSQWLTLVRALGPAWGGQTMHRARVLAALTGAAGQERSLS